MKVNRAKENFTEVGKNSPPPMTACGADTCATAFTWTLNRSHEVQDGVAFQKSSSQNPLYLTIIIA